MKVRVENKVVDISKLDVIGSGGEGLVVKTSLNGREPQALKVYHNPTKERSKKLNEFFNQSWDLPLEKIALPQKPIYNQKGNLIVGVTMPYLGSGFEEVALFANRKKRLTYGVTNKLVAEIFLDGHGSLQDIHKQGLIIGDFNDLNVLFRDNEMLWIDVDAWQFGTFPCPVATLEFLDPSLYGIDLSKMPVFTKTHDWYSFAVMLFRSLLLTHPYGGVHSQYKTIQTRATNKVPVLDIDVKYPKIAFSPDILSDELAEEFLKIFKKGERKVFPKSLLEEYLDSLTECSSCHTFYPSTRMGCPVCNKRTLVIISKPVIETKDVRAFNMFSTKGNIVYTKVQGSHVYTITHFKKDATLHIINSDGFVTEKYLGKVRKGIRYVIADDLLVINPIHSPDLKVIDIKNDPKLIYESVTEVFSPSRKAAFQVTKDKVIRIIGGNFMAMEKGGKNILERHIRNGLPNQTWFAANESSNKMQLFGLFQILKDRKYWYTYQGLHFEPDITNLDKGEALKDISVKFSSDTVILRRKTIKNGVNYLRTEIIDGKGEIVFSNILKLKDHPVNTIHGQVFSSGLLLHASDDGIIQEDVRKAKFKTFTQTEPFVQEGDSLIKYQNGLLVAGSNTLTYLELIKN